MADCAVALNRARWLRHEAHIERVWIANLERNRAPAWLVDEHRKRLERFDRAASAAEAHVAELAP